MTDYRPHYEYLARHGYGPWYVFMVLHDLDMPENPPVARHLESLLDVDILDEEVRSEGAQVYKNILGSDHYVEPQDIPDVIYRSIFALQRTGYSLDSIFFDLDCATALDYGAEKAIYEWLDDKGKDHTFARLVSLYYATHAAAPHRYPGNTVVFGNPGFILEFHSNHKEKILHQAIDVVSTHLYDQLRINLCLLDIHLKVPDMLGPEVELAVKKEAHRKGFELFTHLMFEKEISYDDLCNFLDDDVLNTEFVRKYFLDSLEKEPVPWSSLKIFYDYEAGEVISFDEYQSRRNQTKKGIEL